MNRPFGPIDWWLLPLMIVAVCIFARYSEKKKMDGFTQFMSMCGLIVLVPMLWFIFTEIGARKKWFNVPNPIEYAELIIENNVARCPEGFHMEEGRRNAILCVKEIPR